MRLYCRVAVRSFIFITIFPFSKALTINALPATVTDGQVETVTWTRDQDKDPTHFQFIQTRGSQLYLPIGPTFSVKKEQTQGTFAVTFTGAGSQVMIWANNLDTAFLPIVGKSSAPTLSTTIVSVTQPPTPPTTTSFQWSNVNSPATITSNYPSPTGVASTSTDSLTSISISGATETSRKPDVGAIVGSTAGGLFVLAVFIVVLLKQRNKRTSDSTPFLTSSRLSGTTTSTVNMIQKNGAMVQQREQPAQLEAHEHAPQGSGTGDRIMNVTSGPNEGDDTVQILRYEVDVLKRRIAALEGESAPPDYSSHAGTA
ncbi:hypothetical protein L218DRAFT_948201 [Marasmius fiardii PR-910]|nr:hypothetical protein L218DRAFT_948201 [Marasmius fiardii PR-910]